ncbi:MAG: hypothetical protein KGN84_17445 [Acidobacteriota bacterium]|nr:hypothetical protein [Acidobacteriota bacterium]
MPLRIRTVPLSIFVITFVISGTVRAQNTPSDDREKIRELEERVALLEQTVKTLLDERAAQSIPAPALAPAPVEPAPLVAQRRGGETSISARPARRKATEMPPELLPEIGQVGAEVGILTGTSMNPYGLGRGENVGGFIDLPLFDRPEWLHGKVSYEISIGLSRAKSSFTTTSNVAQVANLTVLYALYPNGGAQNILDSVTGTGSAPFPVMARTTTTMNLLQVVPFSFKYTTTALDRFRLRPYTLLGFGTYVTIHEQTPMNSGVRLDANLPASVINLVNQIYGGQAPFGGPLVAGQIAQSPELEARGLPSGHGNLAPGWVAGGGVEIRVHRNSSIGVDGRWNRIAGAPGSLFILSARFGLHL